MGTMARRLSAVLLLAMAGSSWAGPMQTSRVPSSALWVAHADTQALLASGIGTFVLDKARRPDVQAGLAALRNLTGLDLTRDIRSITAYGTAPGDANGAALIEGTFDREKLLTLLRMNPTFKESRAGDLAVYEWTDNPQAATPGPLRFGTFFQDNLAVVAGSRDVLEVALATLQGRQENLAAASAPEVQPAAGTYLGVYALRIPLPPDDPKGAQLFQKVLSGRLEIGQAEGNFFARLTVLARDPATAADLGKMAEGFLAFLDLAKDLREDGRPVLPAPAATMLKDVHVSVSETTAQAALVTPVANVVEFLRIAAQQKAQTTQAAPAN